MVRPNGYASTTYTYNASNELATSESSAGVTTFAFDGNGNLLTSLAPGSQITTNTWDGENRLTQVSLPTAITDLFTYNGDGQRIRKQDPTGTTKQLWDEQNILLETNASNIIQVVYTLEPVFYGNLISQSRGGADSFYLFDVLGSTRQLASSTGSVTDSYLYDCFGNTRSSSGSTLNCYQFIGKLGYALDADLGQYSLRARTYDPATSRFLSRDPIGFTWGDFLLYRCCHNNPVNFTDPSGLQDQIEIDVSRVDPTCVDNGCGGAEFFTKFTVSDPNFSGTIVQKIQRKFMAFNCETKALIGGLSKLRDYWEAWDVDKGKVTPVTIEGVNDKFITCNMDTFASYGLREPIRTCGFVQINGQAIAVPEKLRIGQGSVWKEGGALPRNFDPCNPKNIKERPWGSLVHTRFREPSQWQGVGRRKGTYHQLSVRWNCCDANDCQPPLGCSDLKVGDETKVDCIIQKGKDLPK